MFIDVQASDSRIDLSQSQLQLHLIGPDGHPAMTPVTVPVNHGTDTWFAHDSTGKADSATRGVGGIAKVCHLPYWYLLYYLYTLFNILFQITTFVTRRRNQMTGWNYHPINNTDSHFLSKYLHSTLLGSCQISLDAFKVLGGPPLLWSAEQPHLYTLMMELVHLEDGSTIEIESCQVDPHSIPIFFPCLYSSIQV